MISGINMIPGIIIGVVVAVASTLVGHILILRRQREQWVHEEKVRKEQWEKEAQTQNRADRLELYQRFLSNLSDMGMNSQEEWTAWTNAEFALSQIDLLGSEEVRSSAWSLFTNESLAADCDNTIRKQEEAEDSEAAHHNKLELIRLRENSPDRRNAFIEAARAELGVDT